MTPNSKHMSYSPDGKSFFDSYTLDEGVMLAFNRIYQSTWPIFGEEYLGYHSLTVNLCIDGRCDVSLGGGKYAIVTKDHVAISTIAPDKEFYYPGNLYEGISFYFDLEALRENAENYLSLSGMDMLSFQERFCANTGVYHQEISEEIKITAQKLWSLKDTGDTGKYRFYMLRLLDLLWELSPVSASLSFFTKGQIALVKKAEALAMADLSVRYSARDFAEMFGISESSFKLYFRGILGKGYPEYFREKRMQKAAHLLESTRLHVADIALSVGYSNQGKFARAFREAYGVPPLEFRRLSK